MVGGKNDWIIEDSEEEDDLCTSELDGHPSQGRSVSPGPVLPEDAISSIKPCTSIPAENTSHISTVGTDHQARPTISSFTSPPHIDLSTISEASSKRNSKPRPRPIFSRTGDDPSRNASISDPIFPRTPTSDPKDRPTVMVHSDSMVGKGAAADIDPGFNNCSPNIAERAKMRTRKATQRSPQYTEDVIDITDEEFDATPVRKPKEKPKPRPIVRATPVGDQQQLPSDPVTIPLPSSSPLLPPSDPFLASTAINSTPLRPYAPDVVVAPDSPDQQSPVQRKKRKRTNHRHSLIDDPPDPNWLTTVRASVPSPQQDPPPPSEGNLGASRAVDLGQNLDSDKADNEHRHDVKRTPKKKRKGSENAEKDDNSASTRPEGSGVGKSKKKTILEVVITSPRKQGKKKAKASKKDNRSSEASSSKSRNDRPASPFTSAVKPVEEDGHICHRTSDDEDELILAPKRQTSSRAKPRERAVVSEEEGEEHGKDDYPAKGASTSCTNEGDKSRSRPTEPEKLAPHQVGLMAISAGSIADPTQENPKPSGSVQEDHRPKPNSGNETPVSGKLRYTLSRFDQKTPMRELIKRATSHPNAPFSASSSPVASPLAKTSKSALRRIAPLHPTRRTPPPPPPRPPPPKKSKKMLQLEEKWEMELEDEVEGWWALADEERQAWRRAKRDKELGYDD